MRCIGVLLVAALLAGCGGGGSDAMSCREYAADVEAAIAETTTAAELERFIDETESLVTDLLLESAGDEAAAQPCADAMLEALFVMAERGFSEQLTN